MRSGSVPRSPNVLQSDRRECGVAKIGQSVPRRFGGAKERERGEKRQGLGKERSIRL